MEASQVKENISQILSSQQLGVLATYGDKYPHTTLVGFAATDDLKYIIFATIRDTRKYKNIQMDARVSILIDSRSNRTDDFIKAAALTVSGKCEEIPVAEKEKYLGLYCQKQPHLQDFVANPNCALMRIEVHRYILVSRFQEVIEIDMPWKS
jgi:nitroimidazol reductase NimA-like FMN-containing flavoprotein (pyridoxamine 5'-phosphate oxidase superfamily)